MLDPGTSLAIVSLALQVTQGLLGCYELWKDADDDVIEIQHSLLRLANIFTQLDTTLRKPHLQEDIVSIIRITMKGCEENVNKLQELLERGAMSQRLVTLRHPVTVKNRTNQNSVSSSLSCHQPF